MEFKEFQKIPRFNRPVVVTEKIDGTNAQICIVEQAEPGDVYALGAVAVVQLRPDQPFRVIYAGSRNRWITPHKDNYGFAAWVVEHASELAMLGPGQHFGEWWGAGIQRRYGLGQANIKRFSLFNTSRWRDVHGTNAQYDDEKKMTAPDCCYVVPILAVLPNTDRVNEIVDWLKRVGSQAAPGFMQPEGAVVYHAASGTLFKITCEGDEKAKSQV